LCGLLESKLSTGSSSRLVNVKRPRLETVAKEQGCSVIVSIYNLIGTGFSNDVQLLEFVLQELPPLIDASDLHAAQVRLVCLRVVLIDVCS
jgi:hypothetical protein